MHPLFWTPARTLGQTTQTDKAVAFVLDHWSPPGQDRASLLAAALKKGELTGEPAWQELTDLYAAQSRHAKASAAAEHRFR